ncbi:PREDICTED: squamous cell carcinoma antigen recognized by T-cells 3-like [Dufourea novaeangliae]|uniref:Squamous cell carcinoma antigen recognized by T-cells 3 n=1 Tax=Dufourea novaeangliae TaxID=178035 RepID=A0A154PS14_DUFNO|nr:PREDICTED: squamous cell carcinoma antigen recognized by T-cells 3-like [Dufourea novaeangliae]KZC14699.1 Squamous cell carcinoma antigen recognized by T-cells 3 [Dufourea novaeangliae]
MEEMDVGSEENNDKMTYEDSVDKVDDSEMIENEDEKNAENESADDQNEDDDEEDADEAELKVLETSLAQNPYDYTSHIAIIDKLQKMGELERLRAARENMSSKYPLSPELWSSWMRDEIKLATTPEEKAEVVNLCERAVKDYLSVEVWLEYLQFSIGNMGTDKGAAKDVRQLFERALTAVGLHTIKGAIIWEAFREFEAVLYALIDPSNQVEKKEQLERIGNLFKRQLGCPLLDMENTFEEYEAWRNGDGTEANMDDKMVRRRYEKASAMLNEILPYEEKVVSSQDESELLDAYKAYLRYEEHKGDPGRIIVLYERAVTDLSLETSVWLGYITYLEEKIKDQSFLDPLYRKASRNVPWCATIWQKWMRSCEKWDRPIIEVQTILENALAAGFSLPDDYRNLWMTYLEYLRRKLDEYPSKEEKHLDILRNTFNRACEHLAKSFGLEGDPSCIILQYWARTEAVHANNMEKARSLWADILSQGHSATASYWLEYISLERCYGDTKHLRKLYQKALAAVKDWPESIARSWIDFERDEGILEEMEQCEAKTKQKLEKVAEERQKAQQIANHELSPTQSKRTHKRKIEDTGRWKNLGSSPTKMKKVETQITPKMKESRLNLEKKVNGSTEEQKSKVAPPPGFKAPEENDKMDLDNTEAVDDKITVFVSNLDYTATEEEVKNALKPAGPITLFKMIRDYKQRSKGFCYVQLSNTEAVETALKLDRTPIRGRPMFVSRCDPNKTTRIPGFKYSCTLEKNKLFVKGLPVTTTKEELEDIFKVHGTLKEVRIVTYRNGHSKGLAYVDFEDATSAAKALLATDGMKIGDKEISVAVSKPPERKKIQTADDVPPVKSLGGTTVSRTTFGMPRTLLSMVPRTVKTTAATNGSANVATNSVTQKMSNQDFRNMLLNKT